MIHLYNDFSRSIRSGDLDLFISSLAKITNYFFAFNQPNYARWAVKNHNNVLKLPETHSEVYLECKNKLFGIKQTPKSFSRSPIDLAFEQTINADAVSQRTGSFSINQFNFCTAKMGRACPSTMISNVFEDLGMTKKEDVSNNLRPHRVRNDHADLNKVIVMTQETMNPFDVNLDPNKLYNIGTGLAAMDSTQNFSLNMFKNG